MNLPKAKVKSRLIAELPRPAKDILVLELKKDVPISEIERIVGSGNCTLVAKKKREFIVCGK